MAASSLQFLWQSIGFISQKNHRGMTILESLEWFRGFLKAGCQGVDPRGMKGREERQRIGSGEKVKFENASHGDSKDSTRKWIGRAGAEQTILDA